MKLSKNCRYLVRVRDYETAHIEVGAEISHTDMGFTDEAWAALEWPRREEYMDDIRALLNQEVDRIAREELEVVAEWSEISPNLAQDYLSVEAPPPARMQRKHHATTTGTHSASSGGVRRARSRGSATA